MGAPRQPDLFQAPPLPDGFHYEEAFISAEEERALVAAIATLSLGAARYKEWSAHRRVMSFGASYDFARNELNPAPPLPASLTGLRTRAAAWARVLAVDLEYALVAEYRPGTRLGWHRDVPDFDVVIGVSLLGAARMRLRPYPHAARERSLGVDLAPRSIYSLRGEARWRWQHAISPTRELRYSITFRTRRPTRGSPADGMVAGPEREPQR